MGGEARICFPAALAVELLHNFTLIHDDIMDRDDTRRGRPTVHKKWDTDVALLAGDGLVGMAYQQLLKTPSKHIHEIAQIFTDGIIQLCEGQALDREFETRSDVQLKEYLSMIEKKTAALLKVATTIGAIVGEGTHEQIQALGEFGFYLGIAFQIQDDLLDITSEESVLGKSFASDLKRHKQTFLLVHALNHADPFQCKRIQEILDRPILNDSDIREIIELFDRVGSIKEARRAVDQYLYKARQSLNCLTTNEATEYLHDLINFIAFRNA